jgi:hypothetical protein
MTPATGFPAIVGKLRCAGARLDRPALAAEAAPTAIVTVAIAATKQIRSSRRFLIMVVSSDAVG